MREEENVEGNEGGGGERYGKMHDGTGRIREAGKNEGSKKV